jgi:hypothetical protein
MNRKRTQTNIIIKPRKINKKNKDDNINCERGVQQKDIESLRKKKNPIGNPRNRVK